MSEEAAYETFKEIRWSESDGEPFCPKCGCLGVYEFKTRRIFKCKGCGRQFSVTSGTIFASRKLGHRDILAAIAIFVNGAKGMSALQLSRDLDVQYKTAFVMAHKLREAIGGKIEKDILSGEVEADILSGEVEVDGAYFGGHLKPANKKEDRVDRRKAEHQTGKRQVLVVARERGGKTVAFRAKSEADSVAVLTQMIEPGSVVHADEASGWDTLHAWYETRRINHDQCFSTGDACTNQAESFFSRMRRAEIGVHHHISGEYLGAYAGEMAWREDNRRRPNGDLFVMMTDAALKAPVSRQWKGYWQRRAA